MCTPNRHITKFAELNKVEMDHVFRTVQGLQLMLNDLYSPKGFNIGINQGRNAGASIEHIHIHVLPRYGSELGYIDIFGKARVVVEGLDTVKKKVEANIEKYLNKEFYENF